jgi:hypothetical protein
MVVGLLFGCFHDTTMEVAFCALLLLVLADWSSQYTFCALHLSVFSPSLLACLLTFFLDPGRLGGRWEIGWCREARSRSGLTGEDYLPGFSGFSAYDASVALFIWVFYGYIFRILLDKGVWCSMVMMVGSMPRRLGPFSFIFIFISSA